jgi:hypothetical protein
MGHTYGQTNSTALQISCVQLIGYNRTLHRGSPLLNLRIRLANFALQ